MPNISLRRTTFLAISLLSLLTPAAGGSAQSDSISLDYKDHSLRGVLSATDEGSKDQIILMIHGTLAHSNMEIMQAFQALLAELGYNSLAVTLSLGVNDREGMFDCGQPHTHRHTDALREIEAWLKWLADQGYSRISLLGHSRGGNQAALYARAEPTHKPDALILIAPMVFNPERLASDYQRSHGQSLPELIDKARSEVDQAEGTSLMRVPAFLHCANSLVSPASLLSYYAPDYDADTPAVLRDLDLPVIVILGTEDPISRDLEGRLPGHSNISTFKIDGADHFFRDLYADDGAEAIARFLSGLSNSQATP